MEKVQGWTTAPALAECDYTVEDAVMVGLFMITFLKHADRIAIATQAQVVNVIGLIMTQPKGKAWAQSIYYPFMLTSQNGRGDVLQNIIVTTTHNTEEHQNVNDIEAVSVVDDENGKVTVFAVNTNEKDPVDFKIRLVDCDDYPNCEFMSISSDNPMITALDDCSAILPKKRMDYEYQEGVFNASLAPCSWNMFVFTRSED